MDSVRIILLLLVATLVGACATRVVVPPWNALERQIESGAIHPGSSPSAADERTLLHTALAFAHPKSSVFNPVIAGEHFRRLIERYPRSSHYAVAGYLAPLLEELDAMARSKAQYERELEEAASDTEELHEKIDRLEDATRSSARDIASYRQMVQRLESEIRVRDQRIQELENTLQRLRNIDLRTQE